MFGHEKQWRIWLVFKFSFLYCKIFCLEDHGKVCWRPVDETTADGWKDEQQGQEDQGRRNVKRWGGFPNCIFNLGRLWLFNADYPLWKHKGTCLTVTDTFTEYHSRAVGIVLCYGRYRCRIPLIIVSRTFSSVLFLVCVYAQAQARVVGPCPSFQSARLRAINPVLSTPMFSGLLSHPIRCVQLQYRYLRSLNAYDIGTFGKFKRFKNKNTTGYKKNQTCQCKIPKLTS